MKKLAYFIIDDSLTPRKAADSLEIAKKSGFEDVIVLHQEKARFYTAQYKEKLLMLFRAAYRNKVRLYLCDDSELCSGTGFGQVCSVRDVRQKIMRIKNKGDITQDEEILSEKGDECVVVAFCDEETYPDLTNPECAKMVIDCVYAPLLREYGKFKGYEFAGFFCQRPYAAPCCGDDVKYMKTVVERFEGEYKRAPDLFSVAARKGDYEKYAALAARCVEEHFLSVLEDYCRENTLELIVGSEYDEYFDFCREHSLVHVTNSGASDSYQMYVKGACDVLQSLKDGTACVVRVMPGMDKIARLQQFFEKNSDAVVADIADFKNADKDCYIITSGSFCGGVGLLLDGDWCIEDWERDAVYDFDKKGVYTIYNGGFLCIRRKRLDVYTEQLPARVGGVLTNELERVQSLDFEQDGGRFSFTLPEESLSGKYIEFSASCDCLHVKMGYNGYECISEPCIFPLYDFLCGTECTGEAYQGKLCGIYILEKH